MKTMCRVSPSISPLDRVIDDFFNEPFFFAPATVVAANPQQGNLPLDLSEDETSYIVRASLPGFTKEQVEISAHEGVLAIRALQEDAKEETTERYHRRERRVTSSQRTVSLPGDIVEDQTSAELKDGVLTIRLIKAARSTPRKIAVK